MPKPTISSFSWNKAKVSGGTTISIFGTNFTGATQVRFGPFIATSYTVTSDSRISVVVPPATGPQLVNVFVQTPAGTSDASVPPSTATWFTYKVAPTVTSVSPNHGPLAGGNVITITGGSYTRYGSGVRIGGVWAGVTWIDYNTVQATVPPGVAPGVVHVVVVDDYGESATSAASAYTYE